MSTNNYGVFGRSSGTHAVYGDLYATGSGKAAVYGAGNGDNTYGVYGDGYRDSGVGVQGVNNSSSGTGVKGVSAAGFPVVGQITGGGNTNAAVAGLGTSGPGVQGQSGTGYGLVGFTNATDGHAALIGYANLAPPASYSTAPALATRPRISSQSSVWRIACIASGSTRRAYHRTPSHGRITHREWPTCCTCRG